jgi:hypothetical protein
MTENAKSLPVRNKLILAALMAWQVTCCLNFIIIIEILNNNERKP